MIDNDSDFWNQKRQAPEGKPQVSEESDASRIEQKIDRLQRFLNDNYRELEETLKKQKNYFNALEIMFYILLGIAITQFVFLLIR